MKIYSNIKLSKEKYIFYKLLYNEIEKVSSFKL